MTDVGIIGDWPPGTFERRRAAEPVTVAVPLPRGVMTSLEGLALRGEDGRVRTVQARCLDRWADDSARWLLLDFLADVAGAGGRWSLTHDAVPPAGTPSVTVDGSADAGEVTIDTGVLRCVLRRDVLRPFASIARHGVPLVDAEASGITVAGASGVVWTAGSTTLEIEETGPVRATVRLRSDLTAGPDDALHLDLRLHFFAGLGAVRAELLIRNPRPARHPNGYWDLGDPGSIHLREVRVSIRGAATGGITLSPEAGLPLAAVAGTLSLQQYSSGGAQWRSAVHVEADGAVHLDRRGYRLASADGERDGLRATPVARVGDGQAALGVAVPQFWQHFPAALAADDRGWSLAVFPDRTRPHELQGGEQKTHVFWMGFGDDAVSGAPLEWCRARLRVHCAPDVYIKAGLVPEYAERHPRAVDYERLIATALDGPSSFFEKREALDEYGWRHFGDLFGDHETARAPDAGIVSHYNNQYDAVHAFALHFMRTGDWRWWELMDDLARHVVDIDIYHTAGDRAAYSGGLFWHTNHYTSAATSTHRSYSQASGLPGGGPSNEHNYTTGLLMHYFLTGSQASADAVISLARWVVAMDDGGRSRFRLIDRGATGLASSTYTPDYHGPGRGAANSVVALLDGHRLTGDPAFLDKAEALIRRCIHPEDDPDAHELLDAERRWSYTVFLQALGRYLDHKEMRGELDAMHAYAREALRRYAGWMARHERPSLDQPERLEFPTETWAAQDLRKADVFQVASAYAPPDERRLWLDRRDAFFRYAVETLARMPSVVYTRPMVLLLTQGARVAFSEPRTLDAETAGLGATVAFPPRVRFVPQKTRALRRLAIGAAVVAGVVVALAAVGIWMMISGQGGGS